MSNLKCDVCGNVFPLMAELHYISRDNEKTGLAPLFSSKDESALYDTYDCPHCGCQKIAKPRKRVWVEPDITEEDVAEDGDEPGKTNEEILDAVGYEAITAYLGLTEKQMATIRQAKEQHTGLVILKGTVR